MTGTKDYSITVVHLVWMPFGTGLFKQFVASYKGHDHGYEHKLVFLFNGVQRPEDTAPYHQIAREEGLVYKSFNKKDGWDLEVYKWITPEIDTPYILFLNSYSIILSDNWLRHLMEATRLPDSGIVGATGSWHSLFSMIRYETRLAWERNKTLVENFRKYKLLIKNFFLYRLWFPSFPNPHIRTNAFVISKELFVGLHLGPIKKKYDAYRWESGRNGFTRQIMKKGLRPLVVDKNGRIYDVQRWKESNTFWIDEQANLLISDNQTRKFLESDEEQRKFFTLMAWGNE